MSRRLYLVNYLGEDGIFYEAVVPEWLLPDIEIIDHIQLAGDLIEGFSIVPDEEPDPGEKEPSPIQILSGGK